MPIQNFGKGAVKRPFDPRDYHIKIFGAHAPVNWPAGLLLANPGKEDQGQSSACVAYSSSYYHNQIDPANYSRRDLYARIFLPGGGAYLNAGPAEIIAHGQATRDFVADPAQPTEANMEDKTGVTPDVEVGHKELAYYSLPNDIDSVAAAVRDYQGAIMGVIGTNEGWVDPENPRPPASGEAQWGHALYAMGFHMHNDIKCIICKSSWCNEVQEHHIKENYFVSGFTFDNLTMAPKGAVDMLVFYQVEGDPNKTVYQLIGGEWVGFADITAYSQFIDGRPNIILMIAPAEFAKLKINPSLFKS